MIGVAGAQQKPVQLSNRLHGHSMKKRPLKLGLWMQQSQTAGAQEVPAGLVMKKRPVKVAYAACFRRREA